MQYIETKWRDKSALHSQPLIQKVCTQSSCYVKDHCTKKVTSPHPPCKLSPWKNLQAHTWKYTPSLPISDATCSWAWVWANGGDKCLNTQKQGLRGWTGYKRHYLLSNHLTQLVDILKQHVVVRHGVQVNEDALDKIFLPHHGFFEGWMGDTTVHGSW